MPTQERLEEDCRTRCTPDARVRKGADLIVLSPAHKRWALDKRDHRACHGVGCRRCGHNQAAHDAIRLTAARAAREPGSELAAPTLAHKAVDVCPAEVCQQSLQHPAPPISWGVLIRLQQQRLGRRLNVAVPEDERDLPAVAAERHRGPVPLIDLAIVQAHSKRCLRSRPIPDTDSNRAELCADPIATAWMRAVDSTIDMLSPRVLLFTIDERSDSSRPSLLRHLGVVLLVAFFPG